MLTIRTPQRELFDEAKQEFVNTESVKLELEHSLVSLSKWESEWEKPFLSDKEKSEEETYSYIYCMCLNSYEIPPETFAPGMFSNENLEEINAYINKKMSATFFRELPNQPGGRKEIITSEVIYYWMVAMTIPTNPCENWHLNRLFNLIKVTNEKNNPKKTNNNPSGDALAERRRLNAERRAQMGSRG